MSTYPNKRSFDEEIEHVLAALATLPVDSTEYKDAVSNLDVLCKAKSYGAKSFVSPDTVLLAATNILGIILVLNYEQLHVVTSKALSFIVKGRV